VALSLAEMTHGIALTATNCMSNDSLICHAEMLRRPYARETTTVRMMEVIS
jgi:hypothetical protein